MALGKKIFQIDYENYAKGMSTSDDIPDGGFSPSTDAINLIAEAGVMYQPAQPTDRSTNVVGSVIASSEDPQLVSPADRVFVDDEGHYYTWNTGPGMILARTDSTNPTGYIPGKTDMVAFDGSVFTSTSTTIVKWTVDTTFTDNFITSLNGSVPHPLLNYNSRMYIGDGNILKRINDASDSTPDTILTLKTFENIVALGIDPGSGNMLISTTQGLNISSTRSNTNQVLLYNPPAAQPVRIIPVDDMVTAFPFTEGQLYAAYGQNLGLWNGSGVTFLRKMDISFSNLELMYKQHFTSIGPTLYFIEKTRIIAHGPVRQNGGKIFYPAFKNQVNSNNLTHIANIGSNILSIGFSIDKFYTWSTTDVATTNSQSFLSNVEIFDNEYWLRWVRIIYKNQVNNNVDPGSIRFLNEDGVVTTVGQSGLFDIRNTSGASSASKDINNINLKLKQVQTNLLLDTGNPGIRRIIGYGEIANQPN